MMKDLEPVGHWNSPREVARRARVQERAQRRIDRAYLELRTAAAMLERSGHSTAPERANARVANATADRVALMMHPSAVAACDEMVAGQVQGA